MNGITIIAEHLCRVVELDVLIILGVFFTLVICSSLILYRFYYKTHKRYKIKMLVYSILVVIIYVAFWIFQLNKYNTTHMEYTVIVDNGVSFNDFHEKYEIISVNGNEYRVVEK